MYEREIQADGDIYPQKYRSNRDTIATFSDRVQPLIQMAGHILALEDCPPKLLERLQRFQGYVPPHHKSRVRQHLTSWGPRAIEQVAVDVAKLGDAWRLEQAARNDDIAETLKGHIEKLSLLISNFTVIIFCLEIRHNGGMSN